MVALDFKLRTMVMDDFFYARQFVKISGMLASKSKNSHGVNEYLKHFQISHGISSIGSQAFFDTQYKF
jgi:hypothetical protein